MPILIIDAPRSMDQAVLRTLFLRGYKVTTTENASEALELIHQVQFDCILIDIATSASGDYGGLAEIRQFVRRSAVALMTAIPVESLIRETLAEGSIEPLSLPILSRKFEHLPQPALLVSARLHPDLTQAIPTSLAQASMPSTIVAPAAAYASSVNDARIPAPRSTATS